MRHCEIPAFNFQPSAFNSELNIPDGIVVMGDGGSMLSSNQCENDPVPFEVRPDGWINQAILGLDFFN